MLLLEGRRAAMLCILVLPWLVLMAMPGTAVFTGWLAAGIVRSGVDEVGAMAVALGTG